MCLAPAIWPERPAVKPKGPESLAPGLNGAKFKQNLGWFLPRRGLKDSAQGFNPGNHRNKWCALKGREIRTRLTCVVATF
jgi:hypothetical protein